MILRISALTLVVFLVGISSIQAQYLQSPCPDIFTYQVDPATNHIFGYIEIDTIQVGQVAKLNVDLSIGTQLPQNNVGSITLVKSREATFSDILHGQPAQYRVNFPLQNLLPTVLNIALNGQTICTGYRAQGRVITTINLEHTLYTQLQSPNGAPIQQNNMNFYQQPQRPQSRPQQQYRPQPQPQTTQRPQIYFEPQTPRTTQATRPPPMWTQPPPPPPRTQPPTTTTTEMAYYQQQRTTVAPPRSSSTSSCGRPASSFLNQLSINGERVSKGQFPWIVPLFDRSVPRNPKYICGSTIISQKHLITAAHCVSDEFDFIPADRLLAIPGMYNIDNFYDDNVKFAYIDRVHVNSEYIYDDDLNDADIAVLRLKTNLVYSEYVVPVCAWRDVNDLEKIVGEEGYVAGWGVTESGSTSIPTYIKTYVVNQQTCRTNLDRMYPYNARIFCGDGRGSTPCNGDSGSGLVIKRGNQYYLRGIVSKGLLNPTTLKCDETKYAVYTDVALFRFWLKEVTEG